MPQPALPSLATPHAQALLDECVHCGLCLMQCPTYRVLRLETESPRGRLSLMRAGAAGDLALTAEVRQSLDLCLVCRACETACPASVRFGHLMELARADLHRQMPARLDARLLRWLVFRGLLPHRRPLQALAWLLRLYRRSPLGRETVLAWGDRLPGPLGQIGRTLGRLARLVPEQIGRPFDPAEVATPPGEGPLALLFTGCVMGALFGDTHRATVRLLRRAGLAVAAPVAQTCCGALHAHSGQRALARALARQNLRAFAETGALERDDAVIVVNAAGCGAMLREYPDLLHDDPTLRPLADRFAQRVRDLTEVLADRLDRLQPALGPLPLTVTYQEPCHLAHAQRVRQPPRQLLQAVPGLRLVEMAAADRCCGSAGLYNLLQPAMAAVLGREKAQAVLATGAAAVVTANPGCLLQVQAHLRQAGARLPVLHIADLLDRALRP